MSTPYFADNRENLDTLLTESRSAGHTIGLVPTMGFLHEGHLSLLRAARARCDIVVMSLFVNPTQFAPADDFEAYPRDQERDIRLAGDTGVDIVYAPAAADVYPDDFATWVEVRGELTEVLCGHPSLRGPEHFRGVTTIVAKLFNAVGPQLAFFGQKDAQQAVVIQQMVRDLEFGIDIVVCPTVREPDGLAMSSRNRYLASDERNRALALHRALQTALRTAENGAVDVGEVLAPAFRVLRDAGIEPEYLQARDAATLRSVQRFGDRPVLVAVAARVGTARLIDNVVVPAL